MQSFELTKPVNTATLLQQFESRFGQTMKLEGLTREELEDLANNVRTRIHTIRQPTLWQRIERQQLSKKSNDVGHIKSVD